MYFAESQQKERLLLDNTGKPIVFPVTPVTVLPAVKKQRADKVTPASIRSKCKK